MLQIVVSTAIFTGIVILLSVIVLIARQHLSATGLVALEVNGQRTLNVSVGDRLLWSLADNDIYLPAACGGRGTCGQCRVKITSGGGAPLATESVHIGPDEAAEGIRLACMLTVREAMSIAVPQAILDVRRRTCTVVSSRNVATFLKELVLKLPNTERIRFAAGDYVLLEAPPHHVAFREFDIDQKYQKDWLELQLIALESVVREPVVRAYSLANAPQEADRIVLVVRIATPPASAPPGTPPGQASSYIFGLKLGASVSISGPFGEFHAIDSHKEMVFIAGGAGIAPIRSIILDQLARGTGRKMSFWYGSRDLKNLCYADEFRLAAERNDNFEFHVALSSPGEGDAWNGYVGFIHNIVYEHYLKAHSSPRDVEYYLCGPPLMSTATVQMLEQLGVDRDSIYFDDFGA